MDDIFTRDPLLEDAYIEYEKLRQEQDALIMSNQELLEQYRDIEQQLQEATDRLKRVLRESSYSTIGGFRKITSERRSIDAEALIAQKPEVLQLPGLVVTKRVVDEKVIQHYIQEGILSLSDLQRASEVVVTTKIYSPK